MLQENKKLHFSIENVFNSHLLKKLMFYFVGEWITHNKLLCILIQKPSSQKHLSKMCMCLCSFYALSYSPREKVQRGFKLWIETDQADFSQATPTLSRITVRQLPDRVRACSRIFVLQKFSFLFLFLRTHDTIVN